MSRPVTYTEDIIEKINKDLIDYIEETDIPIVAEFAYKYKVRRQFLYENSTLSDTIKELIDKKEAQLERKCLEGEINTTMAIFSLKQLGWTDKQEIEHSGQGQLVVVMHNDDKLITKSK